MDFKSQYKIYLDAIENKISSAFAPIEIKQKSVFDAMNYAVSGGGKRLRPILVQAAAEIVGADMSDALTVALAVECIHNYSLIHDDLPCMDNDDLRRGRATCHKAFGEDTALLAGDGLLNYAFEILSDKDNFKSLSADTIVSIIRDLSASSGVYGMIGGQVVDLECEKRKDVTLDELIYLHNRKTGALIRTAVKCGCLCAGDRLDKKVFDILDRYAEKLGLAFQIQDDILDVVGDCEIFGKPIGSDAESGKVTFVSLQGLDEAKKYLEKTTGEAKNVLEPLGNKGEFLSKLADYLLDRKY